MSGLRSAYMELWSFCIRFEIEIEIYAKKIAEDDTFGNGKFLFHSFFFLFF